MKKTEFKEVAHLYIGCDWLWTQYSGEFTTGTYGTDYFNSMLLKEIAVQNGKAKPFLRPLSDMQREEIIELFKLKGLDCHSGVFRTGIYGWFAQIEYNVKNRGLKSDWHDVRHLNAYQTSYLLKQKFDLFELIENGEAYNLPIIERGEEKIKDEN